MLERGVQEKRRDGKRGTLRGRGPDDMGNRRGAELKNELPKVFYENTSKIISPVAGC